MIQIAIGIDNTRKDLQKAFLVLSRKRFQCIRRRYGCKIIGIVYDDYIAIGIQHGCKVIRMTRIEHNRQTQRGVGIAILVVAFL